MDAKVCIASLRTAWRCCQIAFPFNPQIFANGVFIQLISEKDAQSLYAVWSAIVYDLCEKKVLSNAFEVPFIVGDTFTVMWIGEIVFVFAIEPEKWQMSCLPDKPIIKHPVMIAIGGPSGTGKTEIFKRIRELYPRRVFNYPAYTTRPPRPGEQDGVDYYFRSSVDLAIARTNPCFTSFVEARGNWYWINPSAMLLSIWEKPKGVYVFFISQRIDFTARQNLFPELRWIWIYAKEQDIARRLEKRGDTDIVESLDYNKWIESQELDDLVDIFIENGPGQLNQTVEQLIRFCGLVKEEKNESYSNCL